MNPVKRVALAWTHPTVNGVRIRIPFDINDPVEYGDKHLQWAKGTLAEIIAFTEKNCPFTSPDLIYRWMDGYSDDGLRVGIDCSGFVYRVLDEAARISGAPGLEETLGRTVFNTDADTITNPSNPALVTPITRAQDVQPGDVIRFHGGGHAGVVFDVVTSPRGAVTEIWYAHSGLSGGPHTGWVEVRDPDLDMGNPSTQWHDASMVGWLVDNMMRDRYYGQVMHSHYYRGDRGRSAKLPITVKHNGTTLSFAIPPHVRDGVSFAHVAPMATAISAALTWRDEDQTVIMRWRGKELKLQVATETAWADGAPFALPAPPEMILNRTVVPIRSLSGLGISVRWQPSPPTVHLST